MFSTPGFRLHADGPMFPILGGKVQQERFSVEEQFVLRPRHGGCDVPSSVDTPELDKSRVILDRVSHQLG